MSKVHFIAMDTHSKTTDICVKTRAHSPGKQFRVETNIRAIREVIEGVARPRKLTFEEGPMAGWLYRELRRHVDETLVCDPRRNALVAKDGDKDDPVDADKLCDLYIGGYLRAVHHPESAAREVTKQAVGLYHERVRHRVSQANKVIGRLKCWGVMAREKDFSEAAPREGLLKRLGEAALGFLEPGGEGLAREDHGVTGREDSAVSDGEEAVTGGGDSSGKTGSCSAKKSCSVEERVKQHVLLLLCSYDEAVREERQMRREVVGLAKSQEQVMRWEALPGIGWIRAMTLLVYLDTPWRFKTKQALWKYMGIGLVRAHSGEGWMRVRVEKGANRMLKGTILGAAERVITRQGENGFYRQYVRWREKGLSFKNARRNLARSLSAVAWGMWKNGGTYDESQVGVAAQVACEAGGGGL